MVSWRIVLVLFVVGVLGADGRADPRSDLGSPSPQTRDAAAKLVRASYKPPPRARWTKLVKSIRKGEPRTAAEAKIAVHHPGDGPGGSGGGSTMVGYRLDDRWMLDVWYTDRVEPFTVIDHKLVEDVRELWVEPPPRFTGVWTTYFANGQRAHEIHYQAGKYHGRFTSFHRTGTTAVIQNYGPAGAEGDDLGFYPSGKPSYRGSHKAGQQVGVWTFYAEDGSVKSTEDHRNRP